MCRRADWEIEANMGRGMMRFPRHPGLLPPSLTDPPAAPYAALP
ncbi:Uncharacterised protein [Bordetella pertussis]|nr:Uncharacterised protein [Bordetella pertussis]CFP69292.1 Uncharacterised protein [Bordetella pertussis]